MDAGQPEAPASRRPPGSRLRLLYPARGIRRKNIGEALLLSLLLDAELSLTLPPRDRGDLERWEAWRSFAGIRGFRAAFGAGLDRGLAALMGDCDCAVSTSLNEGFGFAFLEPWTASLRVTGRRIQHVAADFEAAGIRLPHLYPSLAIPCRGFDACAFSSRWKAALAAAFQAYGRAAEAPAVERAFSMMTAAGCVDFGMLDEAAQRELIARAAADRGLQREIEWANPGIVAIREDLERPEDGLVEHNRRIILSRYGPQSCARRLRQVYWTVMDKPVRQRIDRQILLDQFLSPERFRMLEMR